MGGPARRPVRPWLEIISMKGDVYFVLTRSFDKM